MDQLKKMARAYLIADENDRCTDEIEEYEGLRPDEIASRLVREIMKHDQKPPGPGDPPKPPKHKPFA